MSQAKNKGWERRPILMELITRVNGKKVENLISIKFKKDLYYQISLKVMENVHMMMVLFIRVNGLIVYIK